VLAIPFGQSPSAVVRLTVMERELP